jgi:hypothetical protein
MENLPEILDELIKVELAIIIIEAESEGIEMEENLIDLLRIRFKLIYLKGYQSALSQLKT